MCNESSERSLTIYCVLREKSEIFFAIKMENGCDSEWEWNRDRNREVWNELNIFIRNPLGQEDIQYTNKWIMANDSTIPSY